MNTTDDARRGVVLCLLAVLVLAFDVYDENRHFVAITNLANKSSTLRAGQESNPDAVATPRHLPIVAHAYDRQPIAPLSALGSVDDANVRERNLYVRGWIALHDQKLADHVLVLLDGRKRYEISAGYGALRSDVATALQNPNLAHTGVEANISIANMTKGEHIVTFLACRQNDQTLEELPSPKSFTII